MNQVSFRTIPFQLEFSFEATTPVQLDLVLTQLVGNRFILIIHRLKYIWAPSFWDIQYKIG